MDSNHQYWLNNNTNPFNNSGEPSFNNSTDGQISPQPFDAMEHARLSPSAFDPTIFSPSFILPKFVTGGPNGMLGYDLNIAEPERELTRTDFEDISMSRSPSFSSFYRIPSSPASLQPPAPPAQSTSSSVPSLTVPTASPIYAPYGSSIVSINPPPPLGNKQALTIHPFTLTSSSSSAIYPPPAPWDPASLNLPIPPPNGTSTNFAGLYSSSGFDLLSVLARVAARPNPILMIGPVDTSASFVVADARKFDLPIVFASEGFTKMTGYKSEDIIGRNCRFLQTPDGDTAKGIPRKFTDDGAAFHMRSHIISGKESQCSLINYKKGGQPFINLCTIIPIAWDSQEVAYFVGLSCDLVAQPAAILDRMKDGSYVVNYSLLANNSASSNLSSNKTVTLSAVSLSAQNIIPQVPSPVSQILPAFPSLEENLPQVSNIDLEDNSNEVDAMENNSILAKFELNLNAIEAENETNELLDVLMENGGGADAFSEIADRNRLFKMVLDNSDDFVHVLSLKASLLYCSPSTAAVLEYDPSEIVGKTYISIIHPNDVNQLMKDLKDAGTSNAQTVSLLYRVRRKFSGYIWIESIGKIHVEPGKTRKCLVLMGRPREVYKMSWNELRRSGGIGETEFWSKLSYEGMVLACTSSVQDLLGFSMGEMVGTSLYQLVKAEFVDEIRTALEACSNGAAVSVKYKTKTRRGYVDVVTRFYPREVDALENMFSPPTSNSAPTHFSIIAQTNELSSEERKMVSAFSQQAPAYSNNSSDGASPDSELDDLTFGISKSNSRQSQSISPTTVQGGLTNFNLPLLSYKSLMHPSLISDNLFDELDSSRCNSWQFELHQLTLSNKGLKDEIDYLKRGQAEFQLRKASLPAAVLPTLPVVAPLETRRASIIAAQVVDDLPSCHECGDAGLPIGRTLCDSCALSASDEGTLSGNGFSPMSVENSASPIDWR